MVSAGERAQGSECQEPFSGQLRYAGDGGAARKALFKGPKGIRCDKECHLYVVDTENHAIRKIDARTNIITTVAGGRK